MAKLTKNVSTASNVFLNDHYPNGLSGLIPGTAITAQNVVPATGASNPSVVAETQNRPGQTTQNQVDQTQQSATVLVAGTATATATEEVIGNAYGPTVTTGGPSNGAQIVQNATYQGQDKGYSQLGE